MSNATHGEQLVGAYHKLINECEIVSYNEYSEQVGDQMEVDVLGVRTIDGKRIIYVCEVVTHLDGLNYGGKPSDDSWKEFGGTSYQGTLDTIWHKFIDDFAFVDRVFEDAEEYKFQFWSPYVPSGLATGLDHMVTRFDAEFEEDLEIVINETYTERIDQLRDRARKETKRYGQPAYRFLQILEHMRR